MSRENIELVRRAYEAWNRDEMEAMLTVLSPDFEFVTAGVFPGIAATYRGHDGWRRFWKDFRWIWQSLRIEVHDLREAGDDVVALFIFDGQGRDGLQVRREFGNVWAVREGLAVRIEAFANWPETVQAAGLSE